MLDLGCSATGKKELWDYKANVVPVHQAMNSGGIDM
jgi:hypothetical protein